ncbi:MAG: pyridoxamine 5'-phosphate oxidase family protein [Rhodospirillales bacterium]|nr:pyridoxamine 5'-phosphate oxidase family protein [Rhodospirillales bacterium]
MDAKSINSVEALREIYAEPSGRAVSKQLSALDAHCRKFISLSPFMVLGTVGDVSPKGDHPGFVQVLGDNEILIPDRHGNNRLDSMQNILTNPKVGLLFFIPGVDETLRINGTAEITNDAALLAPMAINNKVPATGLIVHVEEAYLHCAKALKRSKLWDAETRIERSELPSYGEMVTRQVGADAEDINQNYSASVQKDMTEEGRE